MNYLCCPISCLIGHARWFNQLFRDLLYRARQDSERCTLIEESYQEIPPISRSRGTSFFQPPPSDPISTTPSLSLDCKN